MSTVIELVNLLEADEKIKSVLRVFAEEIEYLKTRQVTKDEFRELKESVDRLVEGLKALWQTQLRTEERLGGLELAMQQLAQAQTKTELRLEELAQAQTKTEEEIRGLAKQIGGISHTIGYGLEDMSLSLLPVLLRRDLNLDFVNLSRKWIEHRKKVFAEKYEEINIYGECTHDGRTYYLVGESKAQVGRKDVKGFLRKIDRISAELDGSIIPLVISYSIHPEAEVLLREKGIKYYLSYELQRISSTN